MKKIAIASICAVTFWAAAASAQIRLSEIRIDQTGADTDEYVELSGPPLASLSGLSLVVIGDGTGGCGVVEAAIDLSAFSIQADGFFALRYSGGVAVLTGYDASLTGSFENSDNLTFLLVSGNTAAAGADLDTDNDGTLDVVAWTAIVDQVGLQENPVINCTTDEYLYATTIVGPDGSFVPGHVFLCGTTWVVGPFSPVGTQDTPGSANAFCPVPTEISTWGTIKFMHR